MVLFEQKWLYSSNVVVLGQMWLYSVKWWYLSKSICIRAKVVVFGQNWLCSGKLIVFGQSGCVQANVSVVIKRGVRGQIFRTLKLSSLPDISLW